MTTRTQCLVDYPHICYHHIHKHHGQMTSIIFVVLQYLKVRRLFFYVYQRSRCSLCCHTIMNKWTQWTASYFRPYGIISPKASYFRLYGIMSPKASYFRPFGIISSKDFYIIYLSNLSILSVADNGSARNASCAPNLLHIY